jgi:hypothetical protein
MMAQELRLNLEPALLDTLTLVLVVEREYGGERTLTVACHHFHMDEGSITLLRVIDGKLAFFAAYSGVIAVNVSDE